MVFPVDSTGREAPPALTMAVYAEPEAEAPVVARLTRQTDGVYELEAGPDAAQGGGLAYAYEDVGLPVMSFREASPAGWIHVLYAFSTDGAPLEGWVRFDASVESFFWADRLPELPLYFVSRDSIDFRESVDGPRLEVPLAPGDTQQPFDYILHSLGTQGPWMRVEVVTPSDYCFSPPSPMRDTLWIRYLTNDGKPRVWYYTRGC